MCQSVDCFAARQILRISADRAREYNKATLCSDGSTNKLTQGSNQRLVLKTIRNRPRQLVIVQVQPRQVGPRDILNNAFIMKRAGNMVRVQKITSPTSTTDTTMLATCRVFDFLTSLAALMMVTAESIPTMAMSPISFVGARQSPLPCYCHM